MPATLIDVLSLAAERYPSHELNFITSSTHDPSTQTKTFRSFNQSVRNLARALMELNKPAGSIILVYLTEHEDNMVAIWACLLAGYVPCLQPALSAQQAHKEGHIAHITNQTQSVTWLTSESGVAQVGSITGLELHLLSEFRNAAESYDVSASWVARTVQPDDEAILFLTSGSSEFPKVVVHTHRTILAACASKGIAYGLTSESNVLNWVGFDHVAGSLEMHLTPLLYGASQLHVHPSVILSNPFRFLSLIETKSINLIFAPNSILAGLTRDLEKRMDVRRTFDLSSITRINSGGEAVVSKIAKNFVATLKRFAHDPSKVSFIISPGFGMTETCAGCIYSTTDVSVTEPKFEFLELGVPNPGCEMRIVKPEDGVTACLDGESGELQVRGPMVFVRYNNNAQATESSFVQGGWFRTGDIGIIQNSSLRLCGRIKETVIIHGVSHSIPELEAQLQTLEGVAPSFLAAATYRAPGRQTEGFVIFYSPSFDLDGEDASTKLLTTHRDMRNISVRMLALPPHLIIPIPLSEMEKTTLGKLSRSHLLARFEQGEFAKHISRAEELLAAVGRTSFVTPASETEKVLARIFADFLSLDLSEVSVDRDFFELGGTSLDVVRLKREAEATFNIADLPAIQILKHPTVSSLAAYIDIVKSKNIDAEEYDPIVPLNVTGSKTPIFMVHPGGGDVLVFLNLAKYFRNERPFYAFRIRGFEPGHPFFTSMDEMVSSYAAAVKRIQPCGPYLVAGYSYGGIVAFEVAKRLEAMGEQVDFTGVIDIPPRVAGHALDWTEVMLNFTYTLGLVSQQDVHDLVPLKRSLSCEEQLASPERLVELQLTLDRLTHQVCVAVSLVECLKGYMPSGSVSVIDVFHTIPPHGSKGDLPKERLEQWTLFSQRGSAYSEVPGEHSMLMDVNNVSEFHRIFRNNLAARGL